MSDEAPYNSRPSSFDQRRDWITLNYQLNRSRLMGSAIARQIPDLLTLLRLILAVVLLGSSLVDGQASPARDIWLLVIGWTTDMADGRLARSLRKERRLVGLRVRFSPELRRRYDTVKRMVLNQNTQNGSWLGQHDVYVDMLVSLAVLGYLTATSLLPLWIPLAYLAIWGLLFWRWGFPEIFAQVFQNPIYAAFVFLTVRSQPAVLPWLLLWAALALLFFWRRLFQLLNRISLTIRGSL